MAPKRATKTSPKKAVKKPKVETWVTKLKEVTKALQNTEYEIDVPMDTRNFLATIGEKALGDLVEDRHQCQTRVVEMVEETLLKIQASLQKALDEQKEFAGNTDNVKKQHEEDLAATVDLVEKKKAEIEERTEKKNQDTDALGTAIDAHLAAAAAAEKADCAKDVMTTEKENASVVYNDCFIPLRDNPTQDGAEKMLNRLEKQMVGMDAIDESLQMAAHNALRKATEERGAFDHMALKSLDDLFKKFDKDAQYTIENSDSLAAAAHQKKDATDEAQKAAEERKKASSEALTVAKKELQELQKKQKEHEKALKGHDKRVAQIEVDTFKAQANLEGFNDFVLGHFNVLKARTAPPAEEENAEEAEEPEEKPAEEKPAEEMQTEEAKTGEVA